jgi:SAM-dependent methyltransferase
VITIWSDGAAGDHMEESILVDLAPRIRRHPWWKARSRLVISLLTRLGIDPPSRVFDAGCGWGTTLEALEAHGYEVTGMDVSRRTLERLDHPGRNLILADLARPIPPGASTFDAGLALDVIEHIDDDRGAVSRLGEIVKPGGWVIVSVPARPDLWTEFDEIQGHRRRYLPETLSAVFEGSPLRLERIFWWGQWLVKAIRFQRSRPKRSSGHDSPTDIYRRYLSLPAWPGPLVLQTAFALERNRALDGKLHTGTSLFAVARRAD